MTTIAIVPDLPGTPAAGYRAFAGSVESVGKTPGQALDALAAQLDSSAGSTYLVVQQTQPDEWFTQPQQKRLAALMAQWRAARDGGQCLTADEQVELETLVEAETRAAGQRAAALAARLRP